MEPEQAIDEREHALDQRGYELEERSKRVEELEEERENAFCFNLVVSTCPLRRLVRTHGPLLFPGVLGDNMSSFLFCSCPPSSNLNSSNPNSFTKTSSPSKKTLM